MAKIESTSAVRNRQERRERNAATVSRFLSSAPWVEGNRSTRFGNSLSSDLPNNLSFKAYDVYESMVMMATAKERGYTNSRWLSWDEAHDNKLSVTGSKAVSLEVLSPLTFVREVGTDETPYAESAFSRTASYRHANYFNIEELHTENNGIFRAQPPAPKFFRLRDKRTFDNNRSEVIRAMARRYPKDTELAKGIADNEAIQDFVRRDFDRYNAVLLDNDPRYKNLTEADKNVLVSAHHAISDYFISRELGFEPSGDFAMTKAQAESFAKIIKEQPNVLLDISHDVDIAVDTAFNRENVFSSERAYSASPAIFKSADSVSPFPRVYSKEGFLEISENDDLIYSAARSLPDKDLETVKALEPGESMVFVNYQGQVTDNLFLTNTVLPENLMTLSEAEKAFKEADDAYRAEARTEPVKFTMYSNVKGRIVRYSGRYDLGSDEGGLARHLLRHNTDYLHSPRYRDFLKMTLGTEGLKEKMREYAFSENVLVPMVHRELEIPLSEEELSFYEARRDERLAEEFQVSADYAFEEEENYKPNIDYDLNVESRDIDSDSSKASQDLKDAADIKNFKKEVNKMAEEQAPGGAQNAGNAGSRTSLAQSAAKTIPKVQTFDQIMARVLHGPNAFHQVNSLEKAVNQAQYDAIARENAILAEGDRMADEKEGTIAHIRDSLAYREREEASNTDDGQMITEKNSNIDEGKAIAGAMLKNYIKMSKEERDARFASAERAQKEEKIMADETKKTEQKEYNASAKQRKLVVRYWDSLHPYHKAHFDKDMIDPAKVDINDYKVDGNLVSTAVGTAFARMTLKHYMSQEDMDKLTCDETVAKAKACKGKINLAQQKELTENGVPFTPEMSMDEAKKLIAKLPCTDKQLELMTRNGMVKEEAMTKTRGEASAFIAAAIEQRNDFNSRPVSQEIYDTAVKAGIIKEGVVYTNSEWEKDSIRAKAPESMMAYVERWQLYDKLANLTNPKYASSKYYGTDPENIKAVSKAINDHRQLLVEKENAPMTVEQGKYLAKCGVDMDKNARWIEAENAIVKQKYEARLIGVSTAQYLTRNPHIALPQSYYEAKDNMLHLNDAQKQTIREEVSKVVDEAKAADRLKAIREVPAVPRDKQWLMDTARLVAYAHLDRDTMTIKGAEADMAKALVCQAGYDKVSDYAVARLPKMHDADGKEIKPTKNQFLAHVITNTLPQNVGPGKYFEAMEKNMKLVNAAEKALIKEQAKDKAKTEVKENAKSKSKTKSQQQSAGMAD